MQVFISFTSVHVSFEEVYGVTDILFGVVADFALYRQEALVADIIERGEIFIPLDAALAERHFFKRAACDERVFFMP